MKTLLISVLLFLSSPSYADWNSWETPPEKGELYMYVILEPCALLKDRQYLVVTPYDPANPEFHWEHNGWWQVTPETLWEWFHEGSPLIYSPYGLIHSNEPSVIFMREFLGITPKPS